MKAACKAAEKNRKERVQKGQDSSEDEEDKHSSQGGSDSESDTEPDNECRDCSERLLEGSDWWCSNCGYGLCADCRPGSALSHLYGCSKAYKSILNKRKKHV